LIKEIRKKNTKGVETNTKEQRLISFPYSSRLPTSVYQSHGAVSHTISCALMQSFKRPVNVNVT